MQSYQLLPQPEQLTELYFDNHLRLPQNLDTDQTATSSFTIRNLEHEPVRYPYLVTASSAAEQSIIASGEVQLNHMEQESIPFTVQVASAGARTEIEVMLLNSGQSIRFFINTTN